MVQIATGIYNNAALDVGSAPRTAPCSYHEPLNTVRFIYTTVLYALIEPARSNSLRHSWL